MRFMCSRRERYEFRQFLSWGGIFLFNVLVLVLLRCSRETSPIWRMPAPGEDVGNLLERVTTYSNAGDARIVAARCRYITVVFMGRCERDRGLDSLYTQAESLFSRKGVSVVCVEDDNRVFNVTSDTCARIVASRTGSLLRECFGVPAAASAVVAWAALNGTILYSSWNVPRPSQLMEVFP